MLVSKALACRIRHTANLAIWTRMLTGRRKTAVGRILLEDLSDEAVMKSFETLVGKTTRAAMADDRQIKQIISRIVPTSTMVHIQFCRVEGGRVRLTVDSAAWISRIRFMERRIIDNLRGTGRDTHTISYHVAPETQPVARKTIRKAIKAAGSSYSIEAAVEAISHDDTDSGDDRLRQELLKLARTLRAESGKDVD
ncbi:MAG: DciA family protein [Granulosicoccus sp.]